MCARPVLLTTLFVMIALGSGLSKALAGNATMLFFVEHERGALPRNTRVIVTSKFVRIDDGENAGDFLLFDCAKRSIFVTNSLDKRILMINARPLELPPPTPFEHRTETGGEGYSGVAVRKVIHYRLFTNSEKCLDVYAASRSVNRRAASPEGISSGACRRARGDRAIFTHRVSIGMRSGQQHFSSRAPSRVRITGSPAGYGRCASPAARLQNRCRCGARVVRAPARLSPLHPERYASSLNTIRRESRCGDH